MILQAIEQKGGWIITAEVLLARGEAGSQGSLSVALEGCHTVSPYCDKESPYRA